MTKCDHRKDYRTNVSLKRYVDRDGEFRLDVSVVCKTCGASFMFVGDASVSLDRTEIQLPMRVQEIPDVLQ